MCTCICCSAGNLGPNDLRRVRGAIFSVHHKWYNIGLELDIPFTTLDGINANFQMTDKCLTEMLKQWLSRTSPPPSWSGLVEALSSEPVGEKRLAEQIHTQYCVTHDVADSGDVVPTRMGMRCNSINLCMNFCTCTCMYVHRHLCSMAAKLAPMLFLAILSVHF